MILGILGGVGSGKSTVARLFAEAGCAVIDADQAAHQVLQRPEVQAEIRRRFGKEAVNERGEVDRPALAARVFGDAAAVAALNQIVHPGVREAIARRLGDHRRLHGRQIPAERPETVLVLDVSLLASSPLQAECDRLVFVEAAEEVRRERCQGRGWAPEELARREGHQIPLAEKRAMAHWIIDNNGSLESTRGQVNGILGRLLARNRGLEEVPRSGKVDSS